MPDCQSCKEGETPLVYSADGSLAFSMDQTIAPASSVTVTPSARVSTLASSTAGLMQVCGLIPHGRLPTARPRVGGPQRREGRAVADPDCLLGDRGLALRSVNGRPLVMSGGASGRPGTTRQQPVLRRLGIRVEKLCCRPCPTTSQVCQGARSCSEVTRLFQRTRNRT